MTLREAVRALIETTGGRDMLTGERMVYASALESALAADELTNPSVPTRDGGGVSHPNKHEATPQGDGASTPVQTGPGSLPTPGEFDEPE